MSVSVTSVGPGRTPVSVPVSRRSYALLSSRPRSNATPVIRITPVLKKVDAPFEPAHIAWWWGGALLNFSTNPSVSLLACCMRVTVTWELGRVLLHY